MKEEKCNPLSFAIYRIRSEVASPPHFRTQGGCNEHYKLHYRFKSYDNFITVFFKQIKTLNIGMWGVYPEAID